MHQSGVEIHTLRKWMRPSTTPCAQLLDLFAQIQLITFQFFLESLCMHFAREVAVLTLPCKAECDANHLLHNTACELPQWASLMSQYSFSGCLHQFLHNMLLDIQADLDQASLVQGIARSCNHSWLYKFVELPDSIPGSKIPCWLWTTLNCLRYSMVH